MAQRQEQGFCALGCVSVRKNSKILSVSMLFSVHKSYQEDGKMKIAAGETDKREDAKRIHLAHLLYRRDI